MENYCFPISVDDLCIVNHSIPFLNMSRFSDDSSSPASSDFCDLSRSGIVAVVGANEERSGWKKD